MMMMMMMMKKKKKKKKKKTSGGSCSDRHGCSDAPIASEGESSRADRSLILHSCSAASAPGYWSS
jgi:hypothetical protein